MSDCIFCKIASGETPANILYEDDAVVAFADINPQSPEHILVIPRKHVENVAALGPDDAELVGRMVAAANKLAEDRGVAADGYRLVFNVGRHGGQAIDHLHLHLLGGRQLGWPPG
jgi:histidine triad (HIT) family protein